MLWIWNYLFRIPFWIRVWKSFGSGSGSKSGFRPYLAVFQIKMFCNQFCLFNVTVEVALLRKTWKISTLFARTFVITFYFGSGSDLSGNGSTPLFFCTIPFLLYLFPLSITRLIHILQKSFYKDTYFNAYRVQCFAIFRTEKSDCLLSKVILLHCPIRFTKWVNLSVVENVTKRWYNLRAGVYFCNIKYKIIKNIDIYTL